MRQKVTMPPLSVRDVYVFLRSHLAYKPIANVQCDKMWIGCFLHTLFTKLKFSSKLGATQNKLTSNNLPFS